MRIDVHANAAALDDFLGTLETPDEDLSPAAQAFAEMGAGLHSVLVTQRDTGGITDREIRDRRVRQGASTALREISTNRKLSPVVVTGRVRNFYRLKAVRPFCATTFASIEATCPSACPFKNNGCMADAGFTRILSKRLNRSAAALSELQVIAEEAREIDRAYSGKPIPQDGARGGRDLRLHVGGDVRTKQAAELLAGAAARWRTRGGGAVWTFTHSWRTVPRAAFGPISVLASVEDPADLARALERGYAPAIVIPALPEKGRRMTLPGSDVAVIPCPNETRGTTCVECRLCLDRDLVKLRVGIAFGVHGRDARRAENALVQIRGASAKIDNVTKQGIYRCGQCGKRGHNARSCPNFD